MSTGKSHGPLFLLNTFALFRLNVHCSAINCFKAQLYAFKRLSQDANANFILTLVDLFLAM